MVLNKLGSLEENKTPLELTDLPDPVPGEKEILVKVSACGVCHTELDEIEGRTPPPRLPVVLGHQVVGRVEENGSKASTFKIGDRVGIAWIYSACGKCKFCLEGNENLCNDFKATGRDANGGYAQYMTVSEDFAYRIPDAFSDSVSEINRPPRWTESGTDRIWGFGSPCTEDGKISIPQRQSLRLCQKCKGKSIFERTGSCLGG
jgi:hypothetical protein